MDRASRRRQRSLFVEPLETRLCFTAGELISNGAFEAGATAEWVKNGAWTIATGSQFHGGAYYAYFTDASGNPANNLTGSMYQQITIPANAVNPTLTFWSKITSAETGTIAKDLLKVTVKDTAGAVVQTLTTLSNLNAVSTSGPATAAGKYTPYTFALSKSLIGKTVRIDFTGSTDAANPTVFRVDDVGVSEPVVVTPGTSKQIVGYLPYYQQANFSKVDLSKVTWINYFSIQGTAAGGLSTPNVNDTNLATVVNAAHAKGVGVSITVGPQSFNTMATTATARNAFAENIKNYILARNLDGVDIDWESPATGINQVNYGLLIDALYQRLQPLGKKITAAVNPWTKEIPVAATKLMSWVNVMCYDFDYANHSTYAASIDGMNQWTNYGVAKDKLVMGVPFYGRSGTSWSASSSKTYNNILIDYASKNGGAYPAANVDSYVSSAGATVFFNGVKTMEQKGAFIRDNGYGGAMIWELGQDHWDASAKYDKYSLLTALSSNVRPPSWLTPAAGALINLVGNQLFVSGGSATFNTASTVAGLSVTIENGATALLNANQMWSGLTIDAGGKLDIKDKSLALAYTGASPLSALTAKIVTGRNGGSWTGTGLTSSTAAPNTAQRGVGISEASDALGISGLQTKAWRGSNVDATTVLIRMTYLGDANLDGKINADDYAAIDLYSKVAGVSSFGRGNFNYDSVINADDYALIDSMWIKNLPLLA